MNAGDGEMNETGGAGFGFNMLDSETASIVFEFKGLGLMYWGSGWVQHVGF